jgi:redox-sensitive bicupin YhaK (pirin superfamily)
VLAGELEHQDNQGNRGRVLAGEVQVMSAGTGIVHAERNPSPTTPLHLLQIWIVPRTRGLRPRWAQQRFPAEARRGTLLPVVTPSDRPAAAASTLGIDQDASVLVAALAPGEAVTHAMSAGRRAYLFAIAGALALNGRRIEAGDQARITDEPVLAIEASAAADLILIDLP